MTTPKIKPSITIDKELMKEYMILRNKIAKQMHSCCSHKNCVNYDSDNNTCWIKTSHFTAVSQGVICCDEYDDGKGDEVGNLKHE